MTEGAIIVISDEESNGLTALNFANKFGKSIKRTVNSWKIGNEESNKDAITLKKISDIDSFVNQYEPAMLVIELSENRKIQPYLSACRELRIPYCFVKPNQTIDFSNIAVPVSFLMEEKEKAPFAGLFGRFCQSKITIFEPKDYGTKAQENIQAFCTLFDSFQLKYTICKGKKDSFGIEQEITLAAPTNNFGIVIVSASREYGLDDILFGCKENKIIRKAQVPIMLINPRADLYTLCD
ncbi:MAG: hypothetical protein EOM76_01500 [Sphingobacteriia bacterium]|jgi:hypothetical protein|nr:hypothetical protein [Paludibacteraceae bacterium]NCA78858.1 hypothetical protein [Sphingobacteriia bacterium]